MSCLDSMFGYILKITKLVGGGSKEESSKAFVTDEPEEEDSASSPTSKTKVDKIQDVIHGLCSKLKISSGSKEKVKASCSSQALSWPLSTMLFPHMKLF